MKSIFTLFKKEVIDNLRDRRTLLNSLLLGPILGPPLIAALMVFSINLNLDEAEKEIEIGIMHKENAPHLVQFLEQQNIKLIDVTDPEKEIIERTQRVVIDISEDYQESFTNGEPAVVELHFDRSSAKTNKPLDRVESTLQAFSGKISTLRLMVRGMDPNLAQPLAIQENDLSTPESRAILLLGMISYILFACLLGGGMYLAIDSTAGERERHSFEPLLSLPVQRKSIVLGKYFACCLFMAIALLITLVSFYLSLGFMPFEKLNISTSISALTMAKMFLVILPFIFLAAAIMVLVASFTKSYKEAQTYLGLLMIIPLVPIMLASILTLESSLPTMFIPALNQHLLVTELIKNQPMNIVYLGIATLFTLALSVILVSMIIRFYNRERILG